jgi:tRNA(Ile)-lysidine synthase
MLEKIKSTIQKYELVAKGDKIVVAVSGGIDSVSLLYALMQFQSLWELSLHIAHLDHCFRGEEAEQDALFVENLGKQWNIPVTIEKIDVPDFAKQKNRSPQEAAREVRYNFLERVAHTIGGDKIATAHNANDQAETLLLWLARGTGLRGLSGIPPKQGIYIRPLLEIQREEIETFLRKNDLNFRQDSSNRKNVYRRNFVRHKIIPLLEELNPNIIENFCNTADLARMANDYFEHELKKIMPKVIKKEGKRKLSLDLSAFFDYHITLKNLLLRRAIEWLKGDLTGITFNHVESLQHLINESISGSQIHLPDGIVAYKEYDWLILTNTRLENEYQSLRKPIAMPGKTVIPELDVTIIVTECSFSQLEKEYRRDYPNQAFFDKDTIVPPLMLRFRQEGDRFQPFGMNHHKKLQDFFVDEKVPFTERDKIPILEDKNGIIWIVGHRTSERTRIDQNTKKVVHIEFLP